jgi:hypothetical protein
VVQRLSLYNVKVTEPVGVYPPLTVAVSPVTAATPTMPVAGLAFVVMLGLALVTVTVLEQALLPSLPSVISPFGSTWQTFPPPGGGFTSEPAAPGVTSNAAVNDAPGPSVTVPPLAEQVSTLAAMAQLIVPVPPGGVVPFVTVTAPYVGPLGKLSIRITSPP